MNFAVVVGITPVGLCPPYVRPTTASGSEGEQMKEQWEKERMDLRAELAAIRKELRDLQGAQASSVRRGSTHARRRSFRHSWLVALPIVALLTMSSVLYGQTAQSAVDALFIDAKGWVGIGTPDPKGTLDVNGTVRASELSFPGQWGPKINLWDPPTAGIGVQDLTQYFRSPLDFAWFKGGVHDDKRDSAGTGGTVLMVLDGTKNQLDVRGQVQAGSFLGKGAVPKGAVLMWSGSVSNLPAGWFLCDGNNDTPNLSGRFIVGYQATNLAEYDIGKTGGAAMRKITSNELPGHTHSMGNKIDLIGNHHHNWAGSGTTDSGTNIVMYGGGSVTGGPVYISNEGSQPHDNRPPYYALAYIMYSGQ